MISKSYLSVFPPALNSILQWIIDSQR